MKLSWHLNELLTGCERLSKLTDIQSGATANCLTAPHPANPEENLTTSIDFKQANQTDLHYLKQLK